MNPSADSTPSKRLRIISLDGGPSTPLMLRIVQLLEIQFPGFLERADMFSGTSDGAFASLFLARAMDRNQRGQEVINECIRFHDKVVATFQLTLTGVLRMGFFGLLSMFDGTALQKVLQDAFDNEHIGDLRRKKISIEAYNAWARQTVTFNQANARDMLLVDAALASSAFMPMFPAFRKIPIGEKLKTAKERAPKDPGINKSEDLLFDGAYASNSPILPAISDALRFLGMEGMESGTGQDTPDDEPAMAADNNLQRISLLSMGCKVERIKSLQKFFSIKWPPFGLQDNPDLFQYGPLWSLVSGVQGLVSTMIQRQATDECRFAMQLLGRQRFYRFAPGQAGFFSVLDFMSDPKYGIQKARSMADELWGGPEGAALRHWVANYWMKDPSMPTTAPARGDIAATGEPSEW